MGKLRERKLVGLRCEFLSLQSLEVRGYKLFLGRCQDQKVFGV